MHKKERYLELMDLAPSMPDSLARQLIKSANADLTSQELIKYLIYYQVEYERMYAEQRIAKEEVLCGCIFYKKNKDKVE